MNYYQYQFIVATEQSDILLAMLGELAFESFQEKENGLDAYISEKEDVLILEEDLDNIRQFVSFEVKKNFIPYQNWNAVWESNFQPIQVGNFCGIRANFHPNFEAVKYELLINPQMAFGTGHHETTFMMMQAMENLDFNHKKVLDFGCGTGILAILASKLGAKPIQAVDIEEPSYLNTIENAALNSANNIESFLGTLEEIKDDNFDIILANINRHVILETLPSLYHKLNPKGVLLISGILEEDEGILKTAIQEVNLQFHRKVQKGNWLCLKVIKN